jgi:hypothetical protein
VIIIYDGGPLHGRWNRRDIAPAARLIIVADNERPATYRRVPNSSLYSGPAEIGAMIYRFVPEDLA